MRQTIIRCDRCGSVITSLGHRYELRIVEVPGDVEEPLGIIRDTLDVCDVCVNKVAADLKGAAIPEPKPEPAPGTADEPKGEKLDVAKIRAMRATGMSGTKIADELGLSRSTVYRALASALED